MQTPDLSLIDSRFSRAELEFISSVLELLTIDTMKTISYSPDYDTVSTGPGIKYVQFDCEYGTMPMLRTLTPDQQEWFHIKNDAIYFATLVHKDSPLSLPPPPENARKWVRFRVIVNLDVPLIRCRSIIRFIIIDGDRQTYQQIYREFYESLETQNRWKSRADYLKLVYGIDVSHGEPHPHIARYLFNPLVQREVCEFVGSQYNKVSINEHYQCGIIVTIKVGCS